MVFGVIFPTAANILGVLLFLRLPWIVGKAGVLQAFGLVAVCCCCTFITTLSLSAVATNGKILGGGSYFLIARSMGPALGAGVGLCFYMANSVGAAMYFMGTVEAWEYAFPDVQLMDVGTVNNIRVTGFLILVVALVLVSLGIKIVTRAGSVFLVIVLFSIFCMFLGCLIGPVDGVSTSATYNVDVQLENIMLTINATWEGVAGGYLSDNFGPGYEEEQLAFPSDTTKYSFVALMALWFPACTGIMAGSNRSGDLKNPAHMIPTGTLIAQASTSFCYLMFVILYGATAPRTTLLNDKFFASSSAFPVKEIVIFGVMASTIGAGLTSLVSGCRLLSAIAGDGTLPILRIFSVSVGKEPRLALVASGILCCLAIAVGELNVVASILTMFFLMCYTCVNASCFLLVLVNDPNWRPTFKYHHWVVSLLGAVLCVWMMFAVSPLWALVAMLFCSIVFIYAAHHSHQVKWGDGFQGMKFQLARNILMKMDLKQHTKNWRPMLLCVTGASIDTNNEVQIEDPEILSFASQLQGGQGITIVGGVVCSKNGDIFSDAGPFMSPHFQEHMNDGQEQMKKLIKECGIAGFGRLVHTNDFFDGLMSLVQISGLGVFQPNCVLARWPHGWDVPGEHGREKRVRLLRLVQVAVVFHKVMMIVKGTELPALTDRLSGTVDIWWIVADGGILLLLPCLLSKHKVWSNCRTRLFVVAEEVADEDPSLVLQHELEAYVRDFRLNVEVCVKILRQDDAHIDVEPAATRAETAHDEEPTNDQDARQQNEEDDGGLHFVNEPSTVEAPGTGEVFHGAALAEGLHRWRHHMEDEASENHLHQNDHSHVSHGSPRGVLHYMGDNSNTLNSKASSLSALLNLLSHHQGFPSEPPTIGSQAGVVFQGALERRSANMTTAEQLSADTPCNAKDMATARGLNELFRESSSDAELVVTNLPDMPLGESALGYCQLIDAMTTGLERSLLLRGTHHEVITAFT